MRLASLNDVSPDGQQVIISKNTERYLTAKAPFKTLQSA